MKVGLLGPANSVHLQRIANALVEKNIDVVVISQNGHEDKEHNIKCKTIILKYGGAIGYYFNAIELKSHIKREKINVLNVHYASGYGTLGRLSKFHPMIISVWGSDIYSFPNSSFFSKHLITKNLNAAEELYSTSNCMAEETKKYTNKRVSVTPFGVDLHIFTSRNNEIQDKKTVTFGFLKGTDYIYGIDIFINAFGIAVKRLVKNGIEAKAIICGGGRRDKEIKNMISECGLGDRINMMGRVSYKEMPNIISSCDIVCIPSLEESFGVVAIEAMACGVPCIVSTAPGLQEVIINNKTGYVFNSIEECSEKMCDLAMDYSLRESFGIASRRHVCSLYDFTDNIETFISGFKRVMEEN